MSDFLKVDLYFENGGRREYTIEFIISASVLKSMKLEKICFHTLQCFNFSPSIRNTYPAVFNATCTRKSLSLFFWFTI